MKQKRPIFVGISPGVLAISKNGHFINMANLSFSSTPTLMCSNKPARDVKKEVAIDVLDNGHYSLSLLWDGRLVASAFLKPAEAEALALGILADLEKRRNP